MKERPILFSAPMVRAILDGKKTQTRRLVKNPELLSDICGGGVEPVVWWPLTAVGEQAPCPYGVPGDQLWVRETHAQFAVGNRTGLAPQCVAYRSTCDDDGAFDYVNNGDEVMRIKVTKWTPAIHMPRWASRIQLEVTGVRVERLCDITIENVLAEGVEVSYPCDCDVCLRASNLCPATASATIMEFASLWDSINGKRASWESNPWVWAVEFRRAEAKLQERAA
jgi:hypothetical protein